VRIDVEHTLYNEFAFDAITTTFQTTSRPKIYSYIDTEDNTTVPASLQHFCASPTLREDQFGSNKTSVRRSFKPNVLVPIVGQTPGTSITTWAVEPAYNRWISCSNPTVPHYGLKFLAEYVCLVGGIEISPKTTFHLEFKEVKYQ